LPLAHLFIDERVSSGESFEGISGEAVRLLLAHDLTLGKVREVENAIKGATIMEPSPIVTSSSLRRPSGLPDKNPAIWTLKRILRGITLASGFA